jgi:pyrimidine deaminase RibD-like protein
MKIEYETNVVDGSLITLKIGNHEFEATLNDEEPPLYEIYIPKYSLADFPIKELRSDIEIKVCDKFELSKEYDDIPVINGTAYIFRKIADDRILISFEDTGRRKFWDGEIGFKIYMDAKKQAIEGRAREIGDTKLDFFEDDGDYIIMNFSSEFQIENLTTAVTFAEQILNQIETATDFILDEKLKKMIGNKVDFEAAIIQETNLELMRLAIDNGKKSIPEEGKLSPKVGAAIIKDGKLLGVSFRGQKGIGDHAEYTLFEKILQGQDVSGATLFTTLEPCTSRNKHKPCSDWIIEKGIKHVVIGYLDPNPKIYNNGCKKLKAAGIELSYFPRHLREEIMTDNATFIEQFNANPSLMGTATFDYKNNNGLYIIGNNEMIFETKWSSAGDGKIHAYNEPGTIKTIAIADGNNEISEIKDASIYNSSSRARTIHKGEILVLENINGFFAAIKIIDVKYKRSAETINELAFEFRILDDKTSNFNVL